MKWAQNKRGFTIAELVVVIAVIAILVAVSYVGYNAVQNNASSAAAATTLKQVNDKIKLWVAKNNGVSPETVSVAGVTSTGNVEIEYWRFDNNVNYCLAAIPTKGDPYYVISNKNDPAKKGKCSAIDWVAGTPLAFNETPNTSVPLTPTVSGQINATMYVVVNFINANASYSNYGGFLPSTGTNAYRFQTGAAASLAAGYRLDTPDAPNLTGSQNNVRDGGTHIGWIRVSDDMTVRQFAFDKVEPQSSASIAPGTGWSFTSLNLPAATTSHEPRAIVAYDTAHDEATRRSVLTWLAKKYNTGQTY